MNVITFDIPLLVAGLLLLVWAKVFRSEQYFQILCQFVATFAAQYSLGVSWSLGRLVPILSAVSLSAKRSVGLKAYLPFVSYVFLSSLIGSLFWSIPPSVHFWYGDGRVFLQLFNFAVLAGSCIALASAISQKGGPRLLVTFLQIAAVIHGLASVYQLLAANLGLPLIGISRSHGLTVDDTAGDVALFMSQSGAAMFRPGGLMGEPKSVAVLFGMVLLHGIFVRSDGERSRAERALRVVSIALSAIGFLAAFSTSAFFGFGCAFALCLVYVGSRHDRTKTIIRIVLVAATALAGWYAFYDGSGDGLRDVLFQRSIERLDAEMDPPVEASVNKMIESPLVAIFGVGLGGSSFIVMEFLGEAFDYAYAPNVGFILLLVEAGFVGTALFLGVFALQVLRVGLSSLVKYDNEVRSLFVIAVSMMLLCLAGSGIPLGFPLAVACLAVAAHKVRVASRSRVGSGADVRLHL